MLKILKRIGYAFLALILLLAGTLVWNAKEQEKQQVLMIKNDEDLLGRRLEIPRDGEKSVRVNFYQIDDGKSHPLVINVHGGAFIAGDADPLDSQSDRISKEWGSQVATINYTLAKDGYDIAYGTQELVDTVRYFAAHHQEFGINPDQIFLVGYSAGGYHTMAAALQLQKQGIQIAGQVIAYGFIKEVNETYLSWQEAARKKVAPALFILADNDPISEGSLIYQKSLAQNGVATKVVVYPKALHGFIEENNPEYDVLKTTSKSPAQEVLARQAEREIGAWIQALLKN